MGLPVGNPDAEYRGHCETNGGRGSSKTQINRALQLIIERRMQGGHRFRHKDD